VISALAGKIVAENFLPQLGEPVAVARVGDKHRHRHHISEAAAGLLESLVQASKYLADLPVEIAGKRVSRCVRRSNVPSEPDDPPAFGDHRLRVGPRLRRWPFYVVPVRPFRGIFGQYRTCR
jgi:hypothetical protein